RRRRRIRRPRRLPVSVRSRRKGFLPAAREPRRRLSTKRRRRARIPPPSSRQPRRQLLVRRKSGRHPPRRRTARRAALPRRADRWLQPRVVYETNAGLAFALQADLLDGADESYFGPYRDADRLRATVTYRH